MTAPDPDYWRLRYTELKVQVNAEIHHGATDEQFWATYGPEALRRSDIERARAAEEAGNAGGSTGDGEAASRESCTDRVG